MSTHTSPPKWLAEFPKEHQEWLIPRLQAFAKDAVDSECEVLSAEIERLQKSLAFWMPGVPAPDHPLHKRVADDAYLLVGYDGPNNEQSAFELGHAVLTSDTRNTCARSHPHENMDQVCEMRTEVARLNFEKATGSQS